MIAFVKGRLDTVSEDSIVVENQGMGYEILVPASVLQALPQPGHEVKLYTYMHVREDAVLLFGFLLRDDLSMFKRLITVSGVGPKGALGVLSTMDANALRLAILTDDAKAIARSPGIGAKTAGKVILELKDKISNDDLLPDAFSDGAVRPAGADTPADRDAVQALTALGYSASQAAVAVRKVSADGMTVEDILKQSLKVIE